MTEVALPAVPVVRPDLPGSRNDPDARGDVGIVRAAKPISVDLKKKGLGPRTVKTMLAFIEPYWHQNKKYPSDLTLMGRFNLSNEELSFIHKNKFFIDNCLERGITPPTVSSDYLTERQNAAIAIITNFNDRRDIHLRLRDIDVTTEELQGWYSNPEFKRRLADRAADSFDNIGVYATVNLARHIERGNLNAIKFYYEITGQSQSPEAINARRLIQTLVEAVQKHVKDPAVLQAISQEVTAVAALHNSVAT